MKMEKRCGLSTCAKTKVCSSPVTKAAPAVPVRSRKNGMEISRCFMSRRPFCAERKTMIEERARRGDPGETLHALPSGRRKPTAQAGVGIEVLHVLRNLSGI